MSSFKRPGVYVEEQLLSNNAIGGASTSAAAFVGDNVRGFTTPTLVKSWTDYVSKFGAFVGNAELPHSVFQFFSNGGNAAYVVRAVGTGTLFARATLRDIPNTTDTLTVEAANPGAWGNALNVVIVHVAPDKFTLTVRNGATDAFVVERWSDLSMNPESPRFIEAVVNPVNGIGGSNFITVKSLASATAAPNNRPASGGKTLTGGTSVIPNSTDLLNAVNKLDEVNAPLNVNLPGVTDTGTVNQVITWAEGRGDVFVVIDPPLNKTPQFIVDSHVTALSGSSYGALYFPPYFVQDPSATSPNSRRKVYPGGAVLGQFAKTDASRGVHKAPAGLSNRLANAVALEVNLTSANLDALNASNVNAIRNIPGAGICLFGARTLQTNGDSDKYLPIRRTLIYIKRSLLDGTRFAIFEPNDELLWGTITTAISQFLYTVWQDGGLKGSTPSQAYYVKCDGELNTPDVVAAGEVRVEVGVSLQYPAEFVVIKIGQFEAGSSTAEG